MRGTDRPKEERKGKTSGATNVEEVLIFQLGDFIAEFCDLGCELAFDRLRIHTPGCHLFRGHKSDPMLGLLHTLPLLPNVLLQKVKRKGGGPKGEEDEKRAPSNCAKE